MLKIDETETEAGELTRTYLRIDDGAMSLALDDETFPLPANALAVVMRRYGAPFDESDPRRVTHVASLELGEGSTLRHVKHLAQFDVIALDWLVYERPDEESLCVLARDVARALVHLARANR